MNIRSSNKSRSERPRQKSRHGRTVRDRLAGAIEAGFTLIEVTIALGICATVLIALLGLLPASLDTMREAATISTQARISEEIMGEAQITNWKELIKLDGQVRYYDDQGTDITENLLGKQRQLSFAALLRLSQEGARIPGLENEPNEFTLRITVDIAEARTSSFDFESLENQRLIRTFSGILARMTQQDRRGG